VSVLPGAAMRFVVDTTAPVAQQSNGSAPLLAALALTYLSSYERMGICVVSCVSGCSCDPRTIDALQLAQPAASVPGAAPSEQLSRNVSIASVAELHVSQSRACVIRLLNSPREPSALQSPMPSALSVAKWKLLQVRVGWEM